MKWSVRYTVGLAITLFALALNGSLTLITQQAMREEGQRHIKGGLEATANELQALLDLRLQLLHEQLHTLARHPLIANALLDERSGGETLRLFLSGIHDISEVPVTVILTNYSGNKLASSSELLPSTPAPLTIASLIERNLPDGRLLGKNEEATFTLIQPVVVPQTEQAEGALLLRFRARDLFRALRPDRILRCGSPVSALHFEFKDIDTNGVYMGESGQVDSSDLITVRQWRWGSGQQPVSLQLELFGDRSLLESIDRRLLSYFIQIVLLFTVIGILGGGAIAVGITGRIRRLSTAISNIRFDSDTTRLPGLVPVEGNDEIAELGSTFNRLMEHLDSVRQSLQQQARKVVELERSKFHDVVDQAGEGLFIFSRRGRIIEANPAAARLLAVPFNQLLTRPIDDFIADLYDPINGNESIDAPPDRTSRTREIKLRNGAGEVIEVEISAGALMIGEQLCHLWLARDISRRKEAEATLRYYETIISSSADPMLLIDRNSALRAVNDAYLYFNLLPRNQVVGQVLTTLPEDRFFHQQIRGALNGVFEGESSNSECWFEFAGVGRRFVEIRMRPVRGPNQSIEGAMIQLSDRTTAHETEQRLRESEIRYRTLIETIGEGIVLEIEQGRIAAYNPAAERILGIGGERLINRGLLAASWQTISYDGNPIDQGNHPIEIAWREVASVRNHVIGVLRPDGKRVWLNLSAEPFNRDNEASSERSMVISFSDITQRRTIEEALEQRETDLRLAQAVAKVGSWVYQGDTNRFSLSHEACRLYRIDPHASPIDRDHFLGLIHQHDRGEVSRALTESLMTAREFSIEYRLALPDGETCWVFSRCEHELDTDGGLSRSLGISQDISDRKSLEIALTRAKEKAESSDRSKSLFLATMSHEVRTPLNAILAMTETLRSIEINDQAQHYLHVLERNGAHLLALIDDILDLSRMEAEQVKLQRIPFSVERLLQDLETSFRERIEGQGLTFLVDTTGEISENRLGDPHRLRQVLDNLVSNAIKFTRSGSIRVEATTADRLNLRFMVEDSGIGIAEEQQQQIFERFTQLGSQQVQRSKGVGLGLAICKRLVELMGGKIAVDSQTGIGSTFHFTIPLPASNRVERLQQQPAARLPGDHAATADQHPISILLTEDVEDNIFVIETYLKSTNNQLMVTRSGEEGISCFEKKPYDLVLMDIELPGINGYEAVGAMRLIEQRLGREPARMVALSAHALEGIEATSLQAGCDAHMSKPISRKQLLTLVTEVAEGTTHHFSPGAGDQPDSVVTGETPEQSATEKTGDKHRITREETDQEEVTQEEIDEEVITRLQLEMGEDWQLAIERFLERLPGRREQLANAVRQQEPLKVADELHKLRGAARIYGANRLADWTIELENRLREPEPPPLAPILPELDSLLEAVRLAMREWLE